MIFRGWSLPNADLVFFWTYHLIQRKFSNHLVIHNNLRKMSVFFGLFSLVYWPRRQGLLPALPLVELILPLS